MIKNRTYRVVMAIDVTDEAALEAAAKAKALAEGLTEAEWGESVSTPAPTSSCCSTGQRPRLWRVQRPVPARHRCLGLIRCWRLAINCIAPAPA